MPLAAHFVASETPDAQAALTRLRARYGDAGPDEAAVVIALGGDGFMLQTLHSFLRRGLPIYGMNFGSVGFLMNAFKEQELAERVAAAEPADIHPLLMKAHTESG